SWRPQAAMYDWAFAHAASARPVGELVAPGSVMATPSATTTTAAPSGLAGLAPAVGDRAAATLPSSHLLSRAVAPWVGLGGLAAALLLVALFAGRAARRPRRRSAGAGRRRH
ncbi:MAG TPA: hypothetical protein VGN19_02645, partial [Pedococcus sp.]|nr:hypothetical protein [Pedococcus sp.]